MSSICSWGQTNTTCASMNPICTNVGVDFTANANSGSAEVGNDYGCLSSQPNPSWYYFEVATNGVIDMSLSAANDIDFIIYGPFTDLADAISNCGTLGDPSASPIVDCSYSGTNMETPSIPNALVGEVYIMLITNYASVVQNISLTQTGGTGSTNCNIVPPCNSDAGTFSLIKNNQVINGPINLCEGDSFEIRSNNDYILPADTIMSPAGDGIYSAQLLFLVYSAAPAGTDPSTDPNFTQLIIPNDSLFDIHDSLSPVVSTLGCGTYYFVPITADDGIGANNNIVGTNDNGTIYWDTDGNGCYVMGAPIEVKYTCPINPEAIINCTGLNNGVNFYFPEDGVYTVLNAGNGNLISGLVESPDSAKIQNLLHLQPYGITVINQDGCVGTASGQFITPQFANVTLIPGPDCPGTGDGSVYVHGSLNSGNGGIAAIEMNGALEVNTVPFDTANAPVGSSVLIRLIDQMGCVQDTSVTISSVGHNVIVNILNTTDVLCFGESNGTASINPFTVDGNGVPDNVGIQTIDWTFVSTGATSSGGPTNTTNNNLQAGMWQVTVTDLSGCSSSEIFQIGTPDVLDVFVQAANDPQCNGQSNGSINLGFTGGTVSGTGSTFDWTGPNPVNSTGQTANLLGAGNYFVTLTDNNGCAASTSYTLNNPPLITANFIVKNVLCYGENTGSILAANVVNGTEPYSYSWDLPGLPVLPTTLNKASDLPAGVYSLEILDDNGCFNSFDFTITQEDSIFFAELNAASAFCRTAGFQSGNGILSVSADGGGGNFTYEWKELSTGITSNTSTWASRNPGQYEVLITDAYGCTKQETILMDSVNPEAIFTIESNQFLVPGIYEGTEPVSVKFNNESIYFSDPVNPNSDTIFQWSLFSNGPVGDQNWFFTFNIDDKVDTTYFGEEVYTACLVAKNFNDCVDTSCVDIVVHSIPELIVPNVFTPGTEPNNHFYFPNTGIAEFKSVVYNRYGVVVYEFNDISDYWKGTNYRNGSACADGTYFYTYEATATNGTKFSGEGTVTLIRSK